MKINLKELLNTVLDIKEFINRFCNKTKPLANFSKKSKTFVTANDMLHINSSVKLSVEDVSKEAKIIVKQYISNPEGLVSFIESKNTIVVRAKYADKLLAFIGEATGFITPLDGINALILILGINLLSKTKLKPALKTPAMFVLSDKPVNIYLIAHQFHHWLAYIQKLPGYEEDTMRNFKNVWNHDISGESLDKMSIQEILALKDAVSRDLEAINFVQELTKEYIAAKTSSDKLKNGESQNI